MFSLAFTKLETAYSDDFELAQTGGIPLLGFNGAYLNKWLMVRGIR